MVAPVVIDGRLVGWVANRAHHADVGGSAPGSMPPDALAIDEEGLRLPPTALDDRVLTRVVDASRTPAERRGDLDAQLGANLLGVARFAELGEFDRMRRDPRLRRTPDARRPHRAARRTVDLR